MGTVVRDWFDPRRLFDEGLAYCVA